MLAPVLMSDRAPMMSSHMLEAQRGNPFPNNGPPGPKSKISPALCGFLPGIHILGGDWQLSARGTDCKQHLNVSLAKILAWVVSFHPDQDVRSIVHGWPKLSHRTACTKTATTATTSFGLATYDCQYTAAGFGDFGHSYWAPHAATTKCRADAPEASAAGRDVLKSIRRNRD